MRKWRLTSSLSPQHGGRAEFQTQLSSSSTSHLFCCHPNFEAHQCSWIGNTSSDSKLKLLRQMNQIFPLQETGAMVKEMNFLNKTQWVL